MIEKTELEWTYELATFFEESYTYACSEYTVTIADGKVTVTLARQQEPVDADVLHMIERHVEMIFATQQLQTHRVYTHTDPATCQRHADGHQDVSLSARVGGVLIRPESVDDTQPERIAAQMRFLNVLAQNSHNPLLRSLLHTYSAAVNDPANELIYLYEIRDALTTYFGNKKAFLTHLSVPEAEWGRLGRLANDEPVEQERHRGKHVAKRAATQHELAKVRDIVRTWIEKFALHI